MRGLRESRAATSRFVLPSVTSRATRDCCGVGAVRAGLGAAGPEQHQRPAELLAPAARPAAAARRHPVQRPGPRLVELRAGPLPVAWRAGEVRVGRVRFGPAAPGSAACARRRSAGPGRAGATASHERGHPVRARPFGGHVRLVTRRVRPGRAPRRRARDERRAVRGGPGEVAVLSWTSATLASVCGSTPAW
ncbi:hypothetical protein [Streptomyces sp. URMC 129]|uniref:hypothetical protein n=1 Tax=Streptomyces sp. URMC 129 TaxID=3423407 RepID=UPI003F1C970D